LCHRAADYLDVSGPIKLVKAGVFPPPRQLTATVFAWDRDDLDRAIDSLPFVSAGGVDTTWDD
jgi:hypothetical protein